MKTYFIKQSFLIFCVINLCNWGCQKGLSSELEISSPKMKTVQQIPPEILVSMHKNYLENGDVQKAENLRNAYDFTTGIAKSIHKENNAVQSFNLYVPGVGYVLDGGFFIEVNSETKAHIQKLGWVNYNFNDMNSNSAPHAFDNSSPSVGQYMGTTGQSKRLEAFVLPFLQYTFDGISKSDVIVFKYRAHMQSAGWQPWVISNEVAGISGQGLRLEAFEIKLTQNYFTFPCLCLYQAKLYYRAHVEGIGWQSWKEGGQTAGTTGQSKRVEAIQVRLYFIE